MTTRNSPEQCRNSGHVLMQGSCVSCIEHRCGKVCRDAGWCSMDGHRVSTPETRFIAAHRRLMAERVARGDCRFACAERGPSPYCPDHHNQKKGA